MKKNFLALIFMLPLRLLAGGDQVLLQDGKLCSLTVDDLARIDEIEREYKEKTVSRKREGEIENFKESEKRPCSMVPEVVFTVHGATPIQDRIIELVKEQRIRSVRGAEYVFANWPIAKAIVSQVKDAGARAEFLVDRGFKDMRSVPCLSYLISNGVKVRVPQKTDFKKLMHDKFFIGETEEGDKFLVTGSYNLSYQANINDENILVIIEPTVIAQYEQKLDELMVTSRLLKQKMSSQGAPTGSLQTASLDLSQR